MGKTATLKVQGRELRVSNLSQVSQVDICGNLWQRKVMKTVPRAIALIAGLVVFLAGVPNTCKAESYERNAETILADVFIYRPAGVLLTATGTALFVVVLPASAIMGGTRHTANTLVKTPFKFTFRRPIGTDLREYVDP